MYPHHVPLTANGEWVFIYCWCTTSSVAIGNAVVCVVLHTYPPLLSPPRPAPQVPFDSMGARKHPHNDIGILNCSGCG